MRENHKDKGIEKISQNRTCLSKNKTEKEKRKKIFTMLSGREVDCIADSQHSPLPFGALLRNPTGPAVETTGVRVGGEGGPALPRLVAFYGSFRFCPPG